MALKYTLDHGFGDGVKLGMIVLSTDETLENEARQVISKQQVSLVHARIRSEPEVTPETLKMMEDRIPAAASLLPSGLNVIGYACTSAATVIGPERVQTLVQKHHPKVAVTNPISATIAALNALNARKIVVITPYVKAVNQPLLALLECSGFSTVAEGAFEQSDDKSVARISEQSTLEAIVNTSQNQECDAVFVSCTNLRSFGVLEQAEQALDCPVISSNQALIWHMLKLSNLTTIGWGPGRLFQV